MGFPFGADQEAAHMVTWLEFNSMNGIKRLQNILGKIDKKYPVSFPKPKHRQSLVEFNFGGISTLVAGPTVIDFTILNLVNKKNKFIHVKNCSDQIYILGLASNAVRQGCDILISWPDDKGNFLSARFNSHNKYLSLIKTLPFKISSKDLLIQCYYSEESQRKIEKSDNKTLGKKIKMFEQENKYLKKGIDLDPTDKVWKKLVKLGKRTFVPASEISRRLGAGAVDEKD